MALTKIKTGSVSDSITLTTPDINGGTIDATLIGGTTPAAISGTTGTFSSTVRATGTTVTSAPSATLSFSGTTSRLESRGADVSTRGAIELMQATSNGSSEIVGLGIDAAGAATFSGSVSVAGVGSLNAVSSDLAIFSTASGHEGLRFGNGAIVPTNNSGGATDNACNLGGATGRFSNLYLAGGVVFGPASASNVSSQTLDSYEESTFTATLKGSTSEPSTLVTTTGNVTKIGRIVHYVFGFENINTTGYAGTITVNGLPFASIGRHVGNVVPYKGGAWQDDADVFGLIENTATQLRIMSIGSAAPWQNVAHNASSGVYFWWTGTYITSA